MKLLTFFVIFAVFYGIFNWIIKKTNIHNKLFDKPRKRKYTKVILVLMLVCFAFSLEYGQQLLNDKYGEHNYIRLIVGALLGSIYLNFVPLIFRRSKS